MTITIDGVDGIGEIQPGDDLAQIIAEKAPWLRDGDILVVTSKIVSKAEDRFTDANREDAIDAETVDVVARKGRTRIVRNALGLVLAAAGVDTSNVPGGRSLLLPKDPDASARRLRADIRVHLGVDVAIVITDTMGRAWRTGQIDTAIGLAGLPAIRDLRGTTDDHGAPLDVTMPAIADELAGAGDLVKSKTTRLPIAVVRGFDIAPGEDGPGATAMIREKNEDLFHLGAAEARQLGRREAIHARRTVREFRDEPVPSADIAAAVAAAVTAPAPHHSTPWRFVHVTRHRRALLEAMRHAWIRDLRSDGFSDAQIDKRISRGDVLWRAPEIVVPGVVRDAAHPYPDARRAQAERDMFTVAAGAGIENFLIALAGRGLGSAWISSTMFCPGVVREALDLDDDFEPLGTVAIGYARSEPPQRPPRDANDYLLHR